MPKTKRSAKRGRLIHLPLQKLERWFQEKLKWWAQQVSFPGLEKEDVYQELLCKCGEHAWHAKPTRCRHTGFVLPVHPGQVNTFINRRALDIFRRERRRRDRFEPLQDRVASSMPATTPHNVQVLDDIVQKLSEQLSERDLGIILAKAFPSPDVMTLARRDRKQALAERDDGALKMNVSTLYVFDKHVAEALAVSPATVTRAFAKARNVLLSSTFDTDTSHLIRRAADACA